MLFPNAKIICTDRNEKDVWLSNYFQCFSQDYAYSFNLSNIKFFFDQYSQLMSHWKQVLPSKIMQVRYEDMVLDTRSVAENILDFLGLEWDENCIAPHKNPRAVKTASMWQVRQPIYQHSIGRWKNYQPYIAKYFPDLA